MSENQSTSRSGLAARLRPGAVWVTAGRGASVLGTAASSVVMGRLMGASGWGAFGLIQAAVTIASRLALVGLNQAGIRFIAESLAVGNEARAAAALRRSLLVSAVATVPAGALAFAALHFMPRYGGVWPSLAQLAPLIVASMVLVTMQQFVSECLRGFHDLRSASLLSGPFGGPLPNLLFPVALLVASRWTTPTLGLALALHVGATAAIVPFGLAWLLSKSRLGEGVERAHVGTRQLLEVSVPLMLSDLFATIMAQTDLLIAGRYCAPADVGFYNAARKVMILVALPPQIATLTVLSSIPDLHAQGQRARLEGMLRRASALAAVPSCLALLALVLLPGPLLALFFGPAFRQAAVPLSILCFGQAVLTLSGPSGQALGLTGHQNAVAVVNGLATLALLAGGAAAAASFGIVGLATAAASVLALQSIVFMLLSRVRLGIWTHALPVSR